MCLLPVSDLFRASVVYYFALVYHLCYQKGISESGIVTVVLVFIMERGRTESKRGNKEGTDNTSEMKHGQRPRREKTSRTEKGQWKTLSGQPKRVCLYSLCECHTGAGESCHMASQRQSLSAKERWHLVWCWNMDLTSLGFSLPTAFFKLRDMLYLLASGIKKIFKRHITITHAYFCYNSISYFQNCLITMWKDTTKHFENITWQ